MAKKNTFRGEVYKPTENWPRNKSCGGVCGVVRTTHLTDRESISRKEFERQMYEASKEQRNRAPHAGLRTVFDIFECGFVSRGDRSRPGLFSEMGFDRDAVEKIGAGITVNGGEPTNRRWYWYKAKPEDPYILIDVDRQRIDKNSAEIVLKFQRTKSQLMSEIAGRVPPPEGL